MVSLRFADNYYIKIAVEWLKEHAMTKNVIHQNFKTSFFVNKSCKLEYNKSLFFNFFIRLLSIIF